MAKGCALRCSNKLIALALPLCIRFHRLRHHSRAAGNPQYQLMSPSECSEVASVPMQTNLLKLAQQVVRNRKVKEVAGDEPQNRDMLHREIIEAIPGQDLRPGAFKMQLRAGKEAALPLVAPYAQVFKLLLK